MTEDTNPCSIRGMESWGRWGHSEDIGASSDLSWHLRTGAVFGSGPPVWIPPPVGGPSTQAVVTGHRGMVNAPMFTMLDEIKPGDTFYTRNMGKTLGYQVDRIVVIDPNDTSRLKIILGEDRVTLMTCTPYGVNTYRLLVTGHRAKMPEPIPFPEDAKKDARIIVGRSIGLMVLMVLLPALTRRRHLITHMPPG